MEMSSPSDPRAISSKRDLLWLRTLVWTAEPRTGAALLSPAERASVWEMQPRVIKQ